MSKKDREKNKTSYTFKVEISCASCVLSISNALSLCQEYQTTHHADILAKTITIVVEGEEAYCETTQHYFYSLLDEICMEPSFEPDSDQQDEPQPEQQEAWSIGSFFLSHWFQGGVGITLGLLLLSISMFGGALPLGLLIALGLTSTLVTFAIGARSFYHAYTALIKTGTLTMDTLFVISSVTALTVSIVGFFVPGLPMIWDAALLIFGFRHIGLALEESVKRKLQLDKTFYKTLPQRVNYFDSLSGQSLEINLEDVQIDDVLLINPGDLIPIDGTCLSDDGAIYDTIKTGRTESRPLVLDEVLICGMRLAENSPPILLKVTKKSKQSYYARLDASIAQAREEKAPIEEVASTAMQYFIPVVILLSLLTVAGASVFFPFSTALIAGIAIMVAACPCGLGLLVPLGVIIGIHKGAEYGVQFKSGKALQAANEIDTVMLDLHGTLTTGVPEVLSAHSLDINFPVETLYTLAVALEKKSSHPIANALRKHPSKYLVSDLIPENADYDMSHHAGVQVRYDNTTWLIGNPAFLNNHGVIVQNVPLKAGESAIYLARNKEVLGYFIFHDPLRPDAYQMVAELKKLGKDVFICTGAEENVALRYAKELNIPEAHVFANHVAIATTDLERSKIEPLRKLQAEGRKVAMGGDAANDSHALAASDFGFAIQSDCASEITQQEAGAIIQEGSLLPIVSMFAIAQQTLSNIRQNLIFSFVYNALSLLFAPFLMMPGVGVALMIFQTLGVLGNAYRFQKSPVQGFTPSATPGTTPSAKETSSSSYGYVYQNMPGNSPEHNVPIPENSVEDDSAWWPEPTLPPLRPKRSSSLWLTPISLTPEASQGIEFTC